ncbi:hypothetical protein [Mesorhizobium sp. L-8-3]|uniref:hypothetical protein n=1 Tax=Mesorhizobium sp. L-8-3 TaxID=2744522 RepID=UPI001925D665|nr:hypothetical protein [Mesorhizobium sp. L-8-3]BCH23215.1 hypothetical protein MesoLjLb_30000 [Mesorhizobium sp. L-8-3]
MDSHEPPSPSQLTGEKDLRDRTVDGLRAIAETIHKASNVLATAEPGSVASLLGQAADHLQDLSARIQSRTAEETSLDMRRALEENPAAVIAANVLASFALGAEACAFSRAPGTAEIPVQTAQTSAGGLGYLEDPISE